MITRIKLSRHVDTTTMIRPAVRFSQLYKPFFVFHCLKLNVEWFVVNYLLCLCAGNTVGCDVSTVLIVPIE